MADRDNIIRMAREVESEEPQRESLGPAIPVSWLTRFADAVIADFLQRSGQYLTNDASREAAIADAVAAATAPLQARIAAMEGMQVPTVEDIESQHWERVDGAVAWHLVDRHAEDWSHTARLMHAWRDAAVAEAIRAREQKSPLPSLPLRSPDCWCETCDADANAGFRSRLSLCPTCGNKRCPRATHHDHACTGSNAPGQKGSSWENVKSAAGARGAA